MNRKDRVQAYTARNVNREIERQATGRVAEAAGEPRQAIARRIDALEEEWDIERWLEVNAAALAFTGTVLGLLLNKKFFAIPCIVLPFLFQHATQGWCPPVPILRRKGVRTRREIDAEKYALKALRGDSQTCRQMVIELNPLALRGRPRTPDCRFIRLRRSLSIRSRLVLAALRLQS